MENESDYKERAEVLISAAISLGTALVVAWINGTFEGDEEPETSRKTLKKERHLRVVN